MSEVSALIIEDEKPSARRLSRMLDTLPIKVEVMLHSVEEAIIWFENNKHPDLIFLDIQLSDGLSFEIFEKVNVQSAIIFTTAYDAYALKAFKLNSIDYLLKPIDNEELEQAVNKFQVNNRSQTSHIDLDLIRNLMTGEPEKTYKTRFTVKVGVHLKLIDTKDIECFYSENKGTYLHALDKRDYPIDNSLDDVLKELNPKEFFKVNRKHIIHIAAIKDIVSYNNSRLKIELNNYSGDEIIVARERVKDFKAWLD